MPHLKPEERYDALHQVLISEELSKMMESSKPVLEAYKGFCGVIDQLNKHNFSQEFLCIAMEKVIDLFKKNEGMTLEKFAQYTDDLAKTPLKTEKSLSYWAISLHYLSLATLVVSIASMVCFGPIGILAGTLGIVSSFFLARIASRDQYDVLTTNLGNEMKNITLAGPAFFSELYRQDSDPNITSVDVNNTSSVNI